jgi:hypothetical protein
MTQRAVERSEYRVTEDHAVLRLARFDGPLKEAGVVRLFNAPDRGV